MYLKGMLSEGYITYSGSDKTYSFGLSLSLIQKGIITDFIGSDELQDEIAVGEICENIFPPEDRFANKYLKNKAIEKGHWFCVRVIYKNCVKNSEGGPSP